MAKSSLLAVGLVALLGCAANPLLTGGKVQMQLENYDRAIELLTENVKKNPDDSEGYLWLGIAYGRKREYGKATDSFDKAVELDSLYLDKMKTAKPDQFWGGGASYWVTYVNCGVGLMNEEEFQAALDRMLAAAQIQPDSSSTYNYIGYIYSKLGKEEEACKSYEKAAKLGPRNLDARLNLAACRLKHEDYDGALKHLTKAVEIDSTSDRAYYLKGICHSQKDENDEAEKAFRTATGLNPKNKDAFYNLGVIQLKQDKASGGSKSLEKAVELAPTDEDAWYQLGGAFFKLEEYQNAADAFTKVIELNPTNADAYENRGHCRRNLGLKEQALMDFQRAEELRKGG